MTTSNTATTKETSSPSISNVDRLEALKKALLISSDVQCVIDFITNDRNRIEVIPGLGTAETVISKHQLQGIFLIVDGIILELKKIKQIVLKYAPCEEETEEILASIDDAIKIIDLGLKLARISADSEGVCRIEICFASMWFRGFLSALNIASERMVCLFSDIAEICERIEKCLCPNASAINESSDTHQTPNVDEHSMAEIENAYEAVISKRIKAILPKFTALYNKYIFPGGSQLLTDPDNLGLETQALREEVWKLQNLMPVDSEEGMDCRLAIDQLDFLIRLIRAKFKFRESDLITTSLIVDMSGRDLSRALDWVVPGDGGDLDNNLH